MGVMAQVPAEWVRVISTRAKLESGLRVERPTLSSEDLQALRVFRTQLQEDLDLEDDPRYAAMLVGLRQRIKESKLSQAVFRPETLVGRAYPLYASELAALCTEIGVNLNAKLIERLAEDGLMSPPLLIGTGDLPRPCYFARHLVEVLFEQIVLVLKPERGRAYLDVLSGRLDTSMLLYLSGLPGVEPALVERSADEASERLKGIGARRGTAASSRGSGE
jgi:hypothetical protein